MSRLETSIYSLDGNSIWDVALKFERLGLSEMNKNPEIMFQGQDLTNARDAYNFKMQFDKLFSLTKEFYVKIRGTQGMYDDSINEDIMDEFKKIEVRDSRLPTVKNATTKFLKTIQEDAFNMVGNDTFGVLSMIKTKQARIISANESANLRYAKLKMIGGAINIMKDFFDDMAYDMDEEEEMFDDIRQAYAMQMEELKEEIIRELKEKPEVRSRIDIRSTLRLSRFEGSASNVLRDILLTSDSMLQDINNTRILLQESLREDARIAKSIKEDNKVIGGYLKELKTMEEIDNNYSEPFEKSLANMGKIDLFVQEI